MTPYPSVLAALLLLLRVPPLPAASPEETPKRAETPARVIDINEASAEDLAKLPGIGPGLARRIVAFRQKHGPFRRVEDLLAIRGIGPKKWKQIRPFLRVTRAAAGETEQTPSEKPNVQNSDP